MCGAERVKLISEFSRVGDEYAKISGVKPSECLALENSPPILYLNVHSGKSFFFFKKKKAYNYCRFMLD